MDVACRDAQKRADMLYKYKLYSFKKFVTFSKYAWKTAQELSKKHGSSALSYWLDMLWCNVRYGTMHTRDYTLFEFYRKSGKEKDTFLTSRRYYKLIKRFDKDTFYQLLDKAANYKKYSDFIKRSWMLIDASTKPEDIYVFCNEHKEVLVKPLSSDSGKGVYKLTAGDETTVRELIDKKNSQSFLIEEICVNCSELKSINPTSLNTLRIDTLVNNDLSVDIVSVHLRCGCGETVVDNWGAGGIGYPVDIETGIISASGMNLQGGRHIIHPGTQLVMPGFKIPRYSEACKLAKDIIATDPKVVYAGLDLAILPDRIELIEVNFPPAHLFLQAVDMIGRKSIFKNMYRPQ